MSLKGPKNNNGTYFKPDLYLVSTVFFLTKHGAEKFVALVDLFRFGEFSFAFHFKKFPNFSHFWGNL